MTLHFKIGALYFIIYTDRARAHLLPRRLGRLGGVSSLLLHLYPPLPLALYLPLLPPLAPLLLLRREDPVLDTLQSFGTLHFIIGTPYFIIYTDRVSAHLLPRRVGRLGGVASLLLPLRLLVPLLLPLVLLLPLQRALLLR